MRAVIACLLVMLTFTTTFHAVLAIPEINQTGSIVTRSVPLTVRIVFVGFDPQTIDHDYLKWKGSLIQNSVNSVLDTGNVTGISYRLNYEFVYTKPDFKQNLTKFLESIQEKRLLYNPWFKALTQNYFYDAEQVENWFLSKNETYGGFPTHGYTFVFANMTSLPSITERQLKKDDPSNATPHYYRTEYVDKDLRYRIRYRDFTVGWGGRSRLWFLDLAAGPEFWTWSSTEGVPHMPMQLTLDQYKLNIHTTYGKQWLTQFLSDYVYDAVLNLAVPAFVYPPVYSHKFKIVIDIIDNRTEREKRDVPIESTIHPEIVRQAFTDLLPYAKIEVETKYISARAHSGLQEAIVQNTVIPPSDLAIGPYVDSRPLYRYLQSHLKDLMGPIHRDSSEVTLPVFAFAFSADKYFGYTYKSRVSTMKSGENSFLGVSLGDFSLIGLSQTEFQKGDNVNPPQPGKGIGFTQVVIHEVGHSLGLMHPHQFGYLGDFESSAMSYWAWEYKFSQFDKDAVNRAHADQLILSIASKLSDARSNLNGKFVFGYVDGEITVARKLLDRALDMYDSMNYVDAVEAAILADRAATTAASSALSAANGSAAFALFTLVIGLITGSATIFIAFRKYAREVTRTK